MVRQRLDGCIDYWTAEYCRATPEGFIFSLGDRLANHMPPYMVDKLATS